MTTTEIIRHVEPDQSGRDERSERLRRELSLRAAATRASLASRAAEVGEDVGERAIAARDLLVERYHEVEQELPIEQVVQRARLGAWQAARAGLTALLTLPAFAVRGLGALSRAVDDLANRGTDLRERSRELMGVVPPSRAERRRMRARLACMGAFAFAAGVVVGWVLGRRQQTTVTYESDFVESSGPAPDSASRDDADGTIPGETVVDLRSEKERQEPGGHS